MDTILELSLSLHRHLRETSSQAEGELKRPLGRSASILNWTRHVYTVCLSDYPIRLHEIAPRALLLTVWPFLVIPVSHLCLFCRGGSNHAYSKVKSCFTPQQPRSTLHDHGISRQIACKKIKLTWNDMNNYSCVLPRLFSCLAPLLYLRFPPLSTSGPGALHPLGFEIEENIGATLIVGGSETWLFVALKPREVLRVIPLSLTVAEWQVGRFGND